MSYPSGSTLLVTLQNGASPNTGPFDIYINDLSSSTNFIANDVAKSTLLSPGYSFITPLETFRVWAKSDSTITNANVAILSNPPGYNKTISVTGSYDESLSVSLTTASVFLDNGYGLQLGGTIPNGLNTCPATVGVGTSSISSEFNTLVVVKENETGSNYIKFFANGSPTSDYFYFIPSFSSSGVNILNTKVCVDLSGNNYQTTPISNVNVYPQSTINYNLTTPFSGDAPYPNWSNNLLIKTNGNILYSGSNTSTKSITVPGDSFIEVTSSYFNTSEFNSLAAAVNVATNSLDIKLNYSNEFVNSTVLSQTTSTRITSSNGSLVVNYKFYAIPSSSYDVTATLNGQYVYYWIFNGGGAAYPTVATACSASTGGPGYYSTQRGTPVIGTVFYTDSALTNLFNGGGSLYSIQNAGDTKYIVGINSSGVVTTYTTC